MHNILNMNTITNQEEKEKSFEQYKMINESIHQINMMRETSNPFWLTANGLTISGISYLNTIGEVTEMNKETLLISLILVGYLFCVVWLNYLNSIRLSLKTRYDILLEIEHYLPIKFAQRVYGNLNKKEGKWTLTFSELLVPCIFIMSYSFFLLRLILKI
ncbi:RipA family octameric membrane protein [Candidatus Odyssella acanthamoebae]|uniref:Uncharacterized protein n=1 Tax=Candidatus Odyssella acanthamoebae TaxID=91604 RepID=A0A077AXI5_9PROT|nr:hypothetical protein [Candidatus Paracaedibacter acanthamoebae]AIK97311.1 hypothetical protein ID47_12065 [Candidatus Paracaedibacter acanthamoebae]